MDDIQSRSLLRACELLSLDFVRPVFAELGVSVRIEESLRGVIRDTLLGRFDASRDVGPGGGDSIEVGGRKVAAATLDVIASTLGRVVRDRFEYWFLYVYRTDDNPWEVYETFFSSWASRARQGSSDALALIPDGVVIAQRLKEATAIGDIKALVRQAREEPLSSWDYRLFEQRGLVEISSDSDYFPLGDEIALCVRMTRFQNFFEHLMSTLPEVDCRAIEAAVAGGLTDPGSFVKIAALPKPSAP